MFLNGTANKLGSRHHLAILQSNSTKFLHVIKLIIKYMELDCNRLDLSSSPSSGFSRSLN